MSETTDVLDGRWRSVCKTLLGRDVGPMREYEAWLAERIEPHSTHKSSLSGKEIVSSPTAYEHGMKWIGYDEIDFAKKPAALDINQIKDIDSVLQAIGGTLCYSGNLFFGKCSHIEKSSNLNDSHYIYEVCRFGNSKYVAYSTMGRISEDCFGCNVAGECAACLKSGVYRNKRCLECWMCTNCSECYFSHGLEHCDNCIFCFNLKSRRNHIGNLELEVGKYREIKGRLLAQMADKLQKDKRLPSLLEILKLESKPVPKISVAARKKPLPEDKSKIEEAFSATTKILFGRALGGGVDAYGEWLAQSTHKTSKCISAASGRELTLPAHANFPLLPKNRLLSDDEAHEFEEKNGISREEAEELGLENAHKIISKLAFFNVEEDTGTNSNIIESTYLFDSTSVYRSSVAVYSKCIAYSFWPRSCEFLFGCDSPFDSSHDIHCYSCTNLTRCFELDCCGYCSDCYFCHNCENLTECMFCFNTKNLKYAIGNVEVGREKYMEVKKMVLAEIVAKLEKDKKLDLDIYNVGAKR